MKIDFHTVQAAVEPFSRSFQVRELNGLHVVDYLETFPELYTNPILRECRGLIFNSKGEVVSRPYHKFANVGEFVGVDEIDFNRPHHILEKLDGSMVRAVEVGGEVQFWTRKSDLFNEVITTWADSRIINWCGDLLGDRWTPIFEWCSPSNRVVIEYTQPRLVLTGVRHMDTGVYMPYSKLQTFSHLIEVVKAHSLSTDDPEDFLAAVRAMEGLEGFVVRFGCGEMWKVKTEEYMRFHRSLDPMRSSKRMAQMVLEGSIDDFLPTLLDRDRGAVLAYMQAVNDGLWASATDAVRLVSDFKASGGARKDFARTHRGHPLLPVAFRVWDSLDPQVGVAFMKHSMKDGGRSFRPDWVRADWEDYRLSLKHGED